MKAGQKTMTQATRAQFRADLRGCLERNESVRWVAHKYSVSEHYCFSVVRELGWRKMWLSAEELRALQTMRKAAA